MTSTLVAPRVFYIAPIQSSVLAWQRVLFARVCFLIYNTYAYRSIIIGQTGKRTNGQVKIIKRYRMLGIRLLGRLNCRRTHPKIGDTALLCSAAALNDPILPIFSHTPTVTGSCCCDSTCEVGVRVLHSFENLDKLAVILQ